MPVTHPFNCLVADDPAEAALGKVVPSDWNAAHTVSIDLATEVTGVLPLTGLADIADQRILGNNDGAPGEPEALTPAEVRTMLGLDATGTGAVNSVTAANASLTISPNTGAVQASLNVGNANTWTAQQTFNTAAPILGTLTIGSVLFIGAAKVIAEDNANFFWDDTNNRLGLGQNVPTETLHMKAGGDRCVIVTDYTGTAATVTSGSGWVSTFNGTLKAGVGWLSPTNTSTGVTTAPCGLLYASDDPLAILTTSAKDIKFATNGAGNERLRILGVAGSGSVAGNVGIGVANPTSTLHLKAGSATAGTAPLKLDSGTLLGAAEAGAVEFLTDKFYGTITTGAARKELTLNDAALTSTRVPYATTNGRLTDSANLIWDNSNVRLGIGGAPSYRFHSQENVNGESSINVQNANTSTAAYCGFYARNSNAANQAALVMTGTGYTTSGLLTATMGLAYSSASFLVTAAAGDIILSANGLATTNERLRCTAGGNVTIGNAAVATNATDGFLYITSCAGTPTGVPTAITGRRAMVWDSTNKKLYVYDGGWNVMN